MGLSPLGELERRRKLHVRVHEGDIRNRVRAWGNYRLAFERAGALSFGGLFTYQSGLPWSKFGQLPFDDVPDYLQDATSSYAYYPEGRGTERFNGWWRLDTSTRYQFPIVKDLNGWVKVDVLNVFDNDELISFDTSGTIDPTTQQFVPSSTFGSATDADYQTPRTFLLTLGLQFQGVSEAVEAGRRRKSAAPSRRWGSKRN